jgi:Arc/MetJ-type ribon-helix-helix transcriptional regulator
LTKKKESAESSQTLRKDIIENITTRLSDSKRDNPVTARLDDEIVSMLDILVKLDIFKSRSEAIAAILEKTLIPQREKFKQLETQITKLEKIQDTAKELAIDVLQ